MTNTILILIVGMFLGWNIPQPTYAKVFQRWIMEKWSNFRNK